MNKKLFINIISLFLFFALFTSFVWPKISEVLESRKKQAALDEKMADLDRKTEKIESLGQELEKNVEDQKIISEYLPSIRGDEFLINYLDNIAYTEEVSFRNIRIEKKGPSITAEVLLQAEQENAQTSSQEESASLLAVTSPKPVFETTRFNFFASYEKIMTLLRKFDGLKRFNEISYLKIIKTYPKDSKGDASLNFLQVELGLDFNHLKKIASQSEISGDLFNSENFDQEVLTKIKSKAINGANDPDSKTDGRNNPFIP